MSRAVQDYLDFCSVFRGGIFFANMNAVPNAAYWTAVLQYRRNHDPALCAEPELLDQVSPYGWSIWPDLPDR